MERPNVNVSSSFQTIPTSQTLCLIHASEHKSDQLQPSDMFNAPHLGPELDAVLAEGGLRALRVGVVEVLQFARRGYPVR